jgi:hypothetical protein
MHFFNINFVSNLIFCPTECSHTHTHTKTHTHTHTHECWLVEPIKTHNLLGKNIIKNLELVIFNLFCELTLYYIKKIYETNVEKLLIALPYFHCIAC